MKVAKPSPQGTRWAATGATLAAVLASACCWLPLVLVIFGVSAAGISATLGKARPFLLGAGLLLLGGGFYLNYFRKEACTAAGECVPSNPKVRRWNRIMLWVATAMVLAVALMPRYLVAIIPTRETAANAEQARIVLGITGMTCETCALPIERALNQVEGVVGADVSYASGRAVVRLAPGSPPNEEALLAAVSKAGYQATAVSDRCDDRTLIGHWTGTISFPDTAVAVVLDIEKLPDGRWVGEVDVARWGEANIPVGITVGACSVSVYVKQSDSQAPALRGGLSADGGIITGRYRQGTDDLPFELQRSGEPQLSAMLQSLEAASSDSLAVRRLSPDARELRALFNADADHVRLVLLLSPT